MRDECRCRPSGLSWLLASYLCAMGGVLLFCPGSGSEPPGSFGRLLTLWFSPALVGMVICGILTGVWAARARIVADAEGLHWRSLGGWRRVSWEQVLDFHETPLRQAQAREVLRSTIETEAGVLHFGGEWVNTTRLREVVARRATGAPAREWGIQGLRPEDTQPRGFDYDTPENRWQPVLFAAGITYVFLPFAIGMARSAGSTFRDLGPAWGLLSILLFVGVYGAWPAVWLLTIRPLFRDARRRRGEAVRVSLRGILFEDGRTRVDAAWGEVTGCITEAPCVGRAPRTTVVTQRGTFGFTRQIRDAYLLRRLIERYAPGVACQGTREAGETLGGEGSLWSGGHPGLGQRVYHYRTRSARALLWLLGAYAGACPASVWVPRVAPIHGRDPGAGIMTACLGAGAFAGLLWAWWRYRVACIRTDDEGITQDAPFAVRRIAWPAVEEFWLDGGSTGPASACHVLGGGTHIRFWTLIADLEPLKAEIVRRSGNSRTREWGPRQKRA